VQKMKTESRFFATVMGICAVINVLALFDQIGDTRVAASVDAAAPLSFTIAQKHKTYQLLPLIRRWVSGTLGSGEPVDKVVVGGRWMRQHRVGETVTVFRTTVGKQPFITEFEYNRAKPIDGFTHVSVVSALLIAFACLAGILCLRETILIRMRSTQPDASSVRV